MQYEGTKWNEQKTHSDILTKYLGFVGETKEVI